MSTRDINFRLQGQDNTASATKAAAGHFSALGGAINQANSAGGNATGVFGSLGGALGNMATVAGGIISAQIFTRIADGIGSFITTGLGAVGQAQQLEASLKSLLTANNMYAESTETLSVAISKTPKELAEQAQKLNDLKLARQTDAAAIQEQKQRIIELTAAYGDNGLNVQTARARLAEMENQLAKTDREIVNLSGSTTEYADVTKTSWGQVMSMEEAQRQATTQTRQLMDAISKLAVVSPFETESVEMVAKYAVAAGMGVEQTKDFTAGFLDMAASVGIGSQELGFAADQLLQVKKVGKLTTIDLRQLRRMGIDVSKVLGVEMGMSVDEFNKKAETTPEIFDDLFEAMTRFSQNTFAGTSQAMATSVKGIQSTLSDVFTIGAREFFRPLVDAVSPAVNDIVGKLADMVLGGSMKDLGKKAADMFSGMFSKGLAGMFASIGMGGSALFLKKLAELFGMLGGEASTLGDTIRSTVGAAFEWLSTNLFPTLSAGVQFVIDHFAEFKGALLGVGAVLAAGVFAALATAVLSLLSPITLLIAGAALLGAAWAGNWGDIQGKTAAAWAVIKPVLIQLVEWLQTNIPIAIQATAAFWTGTLQPALAATGVFITTTVIPALLELGTWLQTNIPAAIQTVSDFWNDTLLPAITSVVTFITGTLIPSFVNLWTMLTTNITAAIQTVSDIWTTIFLPAITGVWTFISTLIIPLFQSLANLMGAVLGVAITALAGLWQNILLPALTIVWHYYTDKIITVFNEVARVAGAVLGVAITGLTNLWQNTLLPALRKIWSFISSTLIPVFAAAGKAVDEKVAPPISTLTEDILPSLSSGLATVVKWIKEATSFFNGLAQAVSNFQLPAVLQPGSPTPFEMALRGIAEAANLAGDSFGGFQGMLDQLLNLKMPTSFGGMLGQVFDDFEKVMDKSTLGRGKGTFLFEAFKRTIKANQGLMETASDETIRDLLQHAVGNWEKAGIKGADEFAKQFVSLLRKQQKEMVNQNALVQAENLQKMLGGVGQFASAATQEADALNKKISVLNSLLRQGGDAFNVEGQIMNAAQAQERLNQLVAEQAGIQGALSGITGFQTGLQGFQEKKGLLGLLGAPVGQSAGDVIGGLSQLTGFLGRQIMGGAGGVGGGGTVNNINFTVNSQSSEGSILQDFYLLLQMIPSST